MNYMNSCHRSHRSVCPCEFDQASYELGCRAAVQSRGGLIQQNDLRVCDQTYGHTQPPPLASTDALDGLRVIPYQCVSTLFKLLHTRVKPVKPAAWHALIGSTSYTAEAWCGPRLHCFCARCCLEALPGMCVRFKPLDLWPTLFQAIKGLTSC